MEFKNCGANIPENQTKCPTCGSENIDETEYISAAGAERAIPKDFSAKKNIIVIIIIAVIFLIGGIMTSVAVSNSPSGNANVSETLQLAERYLSEQNYEQAVIEFQKVLEIEPMNVEAYLGLAEAYLSLGETEKAIATLEEGIDKTGDERLKSRLEEIRNNLNPVTTEQTQTEISTESFAEETSGTVAEETTVTAVEETTEAVISLTTIEEPIVEEFTNPITEEMTEPVATEAETTAYGSMESVTILGQEFDIATTVELNLRRKGITDEILKEIEPEIKKLINLTRLDLGDNQITDITPIAELINLTDLTLAWNQITDITPLARLTNLKYLLMNENPIMDITPLAGLTNLTYLELQDNDTIIDISPLAKLTNLTDLILNGNQITDISPLAGLTNLRNLGLTSNEITNITPLEGLTNLTLLQLWSNPISKEDINDLREKLPSCSIE